MISITKSYDKSAWCNFSVHCLTEKGNVLFEQARLSLECKKLYADAIKPECFLDKESLEKWYGGAHGGFHKMYIVEIENIYSR